MSAPNAPPPAPASSPLPPGTPLPPPPPPPGAPPPYMSLPTATVPGRCPRCGTAFWVGHAPQTGTVGWAFCPRCGQPTPSVPPGTPPPLFSWEIYRLFYPEPRWPRSPSKRARTIMASLLVGCGIALILVGGGFAGFGELGLREGPQTLSGTVSAFANGGAYLGGGAGVAVTLTGLGGTGSNLTFTNATGGFHFRDVLPGEHQLRVIASGYRISQMEIFVAPSLNEPSGNQTELTVSLLAGSATNVYDQDFAEFPDLETYLAYDFSASMIQVLGGLFACWGGLALWRSKSAVYGVLGGASAFLTPTLASVSGYETLYVSLAPWTLVIDAVIFAVGLVGTLWLLSAQRPLDGVDLPSPPG